MVHDVPEAVSHLLEPDVLVGESVAQERLLGLQSEGPRGARAPHLQVARVEAIELALLPAQVRGRRARCLPLQVSVHPFVLPVLLWARRTA